MATQVARDKRAQTRYLNVPETADYLDVGERFVRRLVTERRIAFHRVGRHIRFAVTDLDAFLAEGRVEPSGAA